MTDSFSFSNSVECSEKFRKIISSFSLSSNNCIIGMEATGNYWVSLYSFLVDLRFLVLLFILKLTVITSLPLLILVSTVKKYFFDFLNKNFTFK